jgi:lysozyme
MSMDKPYTEACVDLLKTMEGCRLEAYQDIVGIWTIGYGQTGADIKLGLHWTQSQADAALIHDLDRRSAALGELVTRRIGRNQFSALLSLSYNIGLEAIRSSSALRHVNAGEFAAVPDAIKLWNKAKIDGELKVSPGLAGRRAAECALWDLADDAAPPYPQWDAVRGKAAAEAQ